MIRRSRHLGQRGIAAVEFAICAPFLLLLILGTVEISMLYRTAEKLNSLAGNFAEMVSNQEITSQNSSGVWQPHGTVATTSLGLSPPGLSDLCAGAVYGLQPFPANGLAIDVASVTEIRAAKAASQGVAAVTAGYDEWEADFGSNCAPTGAQAIGVNGTAGARTLAVGNGGSTALVQALGDNVIIVRASLQYPGLIGLILTSAQTLSQTAVVRWRYASAINVTNVTATPAPAATLEFSCSGTGCMTNNGI